MNKFTHSDNNKRKERKSNISSSTIAAVYTLSLGIFLILGSTLLPAAASINSHVPKAFAVDESSEIQTIDINFNEINIE